MPFSSQDQMEEVQEDLRGPESTLQNFGSSEALTRSPSNKRVLEKFAQNMTDSIIQAFMSQLVVTQDDIVVSECDQNQEMLAEGLAAAVLDYALMEVHKYVKTGQRSRSFGVKIDEEEADLSLIDQSDQIRDAEMDLHKDIQASTHCFHPSGLPPMGSLDYPDAPPTTPLLPEVLRGRDSFARKLKGGLAKVFLPSPPPPTPKDKEDDSASAANDPRVELMEHLIRSLPKNDSAGVDHTNRAHDGENLEVFAEALSCNIIDRALRTTELAEENTDIHSLAHWLAETIISSSLDEAATFV